MDYYELNDDNTYIKKSVREWKEDRNLFIALGFGFGTLTMLVLAYILSYMV